MTLTNVVIKALWRGKTIAAGIPAAHEAVILSLGGRI
jgi:hypothetical protein